MKNVVRKYLFLICILAPAFCMSAFSQVKKVKTTIRGEALLHRPISNKAFSKLFSGVFSANLSLNFGIRNFNTGLYYNMMQSQIFPKFQYEPHSIQTVHTMGMKFGYDIYPPKAKLAAQKGNFWVVTPFLAGGFALVDYSYLICLNGAPTGKNTQTYSVNGGANFTVMFSEYDGVGFTLGYTFLNHEFNPDALCLTQHYPNIPDGDKRGLSQYIFYGFNVHFDLVKRESESD